MPKQTKTTTPFGAWLRKSRTERKMTMEQVAERAHTAAPVISNLERGTRNPSRTMVSRIAAALLSDAEGQEELDSLQDEGLREAGFTRAYSRSEDPLPRLMEDAGLGLDVITSDELDELHLDVEAFIRAKVDGWRRGRRRTAMNNDAQS